MTLGPHVLNCTPAAIAWSQRAGIVKAVNTTLPLTMAPDTSIRIFRQSYSNEMDTTDPTGTVNQIVAALKGYWHRNLYIQIWCGAHPTYEQLATAVTLLHMNNLKTVGSSHFTGDYTQRDWDDAEAADVDAHGDQGYYGNKGFTEDHALRHRRFWKPGNKPVMILECGRDAVEGGQAGWKLCGITPQQYADELNAYDAEISKDSYVLGATPFTSGPTPGNPPKGWDPFDMDPISPLLEGNVPDPTTFNVGPGVKDLMTQNGDTPQSDEHYVEDATGTVFKSETFGSKGLYQWNKQANKTVLLPFK